MIVAIIAILVVGGGATGIVLATSGGKKHKDDAHQTGNSTVSAPASGSSGTGFPSSGGSLPPSGGGDGSAPSEADARAVAERYLGDVNTHDESDAEGLICEAAKPGWKQTIDGPNGDFTVHVDKAEFSRSSAGSQPNSIDVTYDLDVSNGTSRKSSELTFTVIDEGGAKICGEA